MRGGRLWANGAFLILACAAAALLILRVREGTENEAPQSPWGFQVFCEGEEISALYLAEDGSLWVGGRDGVKRLDAETGESLGYVAEDVELVYAAEICRAQDGSVWIGHNRGVRVLYPDGRREDYEAPLLTGGRVNAILCRGQEVFVGTMEGANRFVPREGRWQIAEQYSRETGLLTNPVNVIAAGEDTLWFGSYLDSRPGGISILREDGQSQKSWQYLTVQEGLAHPYINAILLSGDQALAASGQLTAGGLDVLQNSPEGYFVADRFGVADGIPGEKVRWLYEDREGHLWITTESDGLLLCKDTSLTHPLRGVCLTWKEGLSDNEIKKIAESDRYYFLAGRFGLTRIEKEALQRLLGEQPCEEGVLDGKTEGNSKGARLSDGADGALSAAADPDGADLQEKYQRREGSFLCAGDLQGRE